QRAEPGSRLTAWRPVLGYWFVSALAAGLGAVHTLKWVMGRPRPYSVLGREHLPYSEWYQVGSHYVTEGIYRGSFPSGHTAAVFILMTLVYAYGANPAAPAPRRSLMWPLGAAVLAYTASMGIASAMARSHWLSDAIAATGMVWVLIHALYFLVLRVPEQQGHLARHRHLLSMPSYWELRFCGWGFIALLGMLAVGLGVRAFWEQSPPYLAVLIPLGVLLWWLGFPRARRVIRLLHERLDGAGVYP
ncbi:MAG TPA: phosphatase PAP2 family protein, partial [bacterium]